MRELRPLPLALALLLSGCTVSGTFQVNTDDDDATAAGDDDDDALDDDDATPSDDDDTLPPDDDDATPVDDDDTIPPDDDDTIPPDDDDFWPDDDDTATDDDDAVPEGWDGTWSGVVTVASPNGWDICSAEVELVVTAGLLTGGGDCSSGWGPGPSTNTPLAFLGTVDAPGAVGGVVTADLSSFNQQDETAPFEGEASGNSMDLSFEIQLPGWGPNQTIDVVGTGTLSR
jgi:hypothetical protein